MRIFPAAIALDKRLQSNNFDLLRFLFSFTVFLVHAHVLSGAEELSVLSQLLSSDIAVKSFFIVSGFLIFMSYENSDGIRGYLIKRVRRIYPAYLFMIIACAVLGSFFSLYGVKEYFSFQLLKYVVVNLFFLNFLQPNLPGLFEVNPLQVVNGALWTLKIEVMFYLLVPLVAIAFRRIGRARVLVVLYACSVLYSLVLNALANKTGSGIYFELQRQLPGQLAYFMTGAAAYYYLHYLKKYAVGFALLAGLSFALQSYLPWVAIQPMALGVLVVCFACVIPSFGNFDKYGDFSYGIYIAHFPILQLVIASGFYRDSPWQLLLVSGGLVLTAACLLWHFIEKPFLRKSSHYVAPLPG